MGNKATQEGSSSSKPGKSFLDVSKWPKMEVTDYMKEDIKRAFMVFDADGRGVIGLDDVRVAFRALGYDMGPSEMGHLKRQMRLDGEYIDFSNFFDLVSNRLLAMDDTADIEKAFKLMDQNDKGFIDLDDLREVAKKLESTDVTDDYLLVMLAGAQISDPGDELRQQYEERQQEARIRKGQTYVSAEERHVGDPIDGLAAFNRTRRMSSSGQQRAETMTVNSEQFSRIMTINRPLPFHINFY